MTTGFFNIGKPKKIKKAKGAKQPKAPKVVEISEELKAEIAKITLFYEKEEILEFLEGILESKPTICFDYETTGIKPHKEGHEIICVSISTDSNWAASFMLDDSEVQNLFGLILIDKDIKKIAHNLKFEALWSYYILNTQVESWHWDSMIAAHILDNKVLTRLKTQVKIHFNIENYDSTINPYIKSKSKSSNAFNRIKEAPVKDLLEYCGLDSMFGFRLAEKQQKEIKELRLSKAYQFFHGSVLDFIEVEKNGICCDEEYYQEKKGELEEKREDWLSKILDSKEAKQWKEIKGKELNPGSSDQLAQLLFDILGLKSIKKTKGGKDCADEEVLNKLKDKCPLIPLILGLKKNKKLLDYIDGFLRESVDGILRPNFNLHRAATYRSSSSNPNFQNIPKRDEYAQNLIRAGLKPSPGNQLLELDYSGIEVRIAACYHLDPVMLDYINDPATDMHRDQALRIYKLERDQITKKIRYYAKNQFVFPAFYGSYFAQMAPDLWSTAGEEKTAQDILLRDHLKSQGIRSYKAFESHIKEEERIFWEDKFTVYNEWKDYTYAQYQKKGFVKLKTGFKCIGEMKRNDVINYPIQGAAFHCLLWALHKVRIYLKEGKFKTKLIGQIHDALVLDLVPEELDLIIKPIKKIMCEELRKAWSWIIVPLDIEAEISEIDGNWANMKELEVS